MRSIVCELCGSNELIKDGDVFVCQHCGTKYTTEEARKLLVEASVTIDEPVRVQGVATVDNLLRRADDFERQKDVAPIVKGLQPESFGRFSDISPWCHNHVTCMRPRGIGYTVRASKARGLLTGGGRRRFIY